MSNIHVQRVTKYLSAAIPAALYVAGWAATLSLTVIMVIQVWGIITPAMATSGVMQGKSHPSASTNHPPEAPPNTLPPRTNTNIIPPAMASDEKSNHQAESQAQEAISGPQASPPSSADTIAALGIVIAAVTLMLSLGTSSIASLQKRLHEATLQMDEQAKRETSRNLLIEYRLSLQTELLNYFTPNRGLSSATTTVYHLMPWFELLTCGDDTLRHRAYLQLRRYFGPAVRADVPATWRYCIEVEHYLLSYGLAHTGNTHCGIFDAPR